MPTTGRSTDYGTVILHAALVVAFVVLVATGLRLATDDPETEWLLVLDAVLPMNHLWFNHLVAGVALAAVLCGYAIYMRLARLASRVRLDKPRLVAMFRPGRSRWAAINVLVYWVLIISLVAEVVTGAMLFFGAGRSVLTLHRDLTFLCLAAVALHVGLHGAYGGLGQLVRVIRPSALVVAPPPPDLAELLAEQLAQRAQVVKGTSKEGATPATAARRQPRLEANAFVTALAVGTVVTGIAVGSEQMTRTTLRVFEIPQGSAPRLDGDLSDPVWAKAKPVSVLTTQGGDFGGTFQSLVEVRALRDADYAYFAFVWEDPTRSLKHHPLVKTADGWEVAASREDLADERNYNEDKLAVLLTKPGFPLIGAAIHLARAPLSDKPASSTERGLHFTDGGIADIWQWRASHAGSYGHVDNCHFGGPKPAPQDALRRAQYGGGFAIDSGDGPYEPNVLQRGEGAGKPTYVPKRLPRDVRAIGAAMGRISEEKGQSESEGARWWMALSETQDYSREADSQIPIGTIVPGVVMADAAPMRPDSIRGVARWSAGRWTLELARRLYTGSAYDVPIKSGVMMWVAAFDHAEKRHTRHLRPFILEVE